MHSPMNELEQLGERIAEQAAHLDAAMHRLLTDLREFDERGGWHAQGAQSCAHWLNWRVGWDLVTARERVRVACKIAGFPAMDDALRRGEVSYSKVRAMLRIATPANELLLLDHARLMTASQLERLCRKYAVVLRDGGASHPLVDEQRRYVRRRDTDDSMVKIEAVLHAEEAELVWAMLNHAAKQLARDPVPLGGSDITAPEPVAPTSGATEVTGPTVVLLPTFGVAKPVDEIASLLSDAATRRMDDSAESPNPPPPPGTTPTAAAAGLETSRTDDSAESLERPSAPTATPAPRNEACAATCRTDDSAESLEQPSAPDTAPTTAAAGLETSPADDSAESPEQPSAPAATPATTPAPDNLARAATWPAADGTERLRVRGANQCLGYFRRPDMYAAAVDADGWFDAGDLVRPDGCGGIRIVGRFKDVIARNGHNVPVVEVESALHATRASPRPRSGADREPALGQRICAVLVAATRPRRILKKALIDGIKARRARTAGEWSHDAVVRTHHVTVRFNRTALQHIT